MENLPDPGPLLIARKLLQKAPLMQLLLSGLVYFFPLTYTDSTPFLAQLPRSVLCILPSWALCFVHHYLPHPSFFLQTAESTDMLPRRPMGAGQGFSWEQNRCGSTLGSFCNSTKHRQRDSSVECCSQKGTLKGSNAFSDRVFWFYAVEFCSPRGLL